MIGAVITNSTQALVKFSRLVLLDFARMSSSHMTGQSLQTKNNAYAYEITAIGFLCRVTHARKVYLPPVMSWQSRAVICHYCRGEGHVKKDCAKKKASDARIICYNCNEAGHIKRDCPHPPRPRGQTGAGNVPTGVSAVSRSPAAPVGRSGVRSGTERQGERGNELRGRGSRRSAGRGGAGLEGVHAWIGTGLEGRLSGIGAGLEGAHARNGRWEELRGRGSRRSAGRDGAGLEGGRAWIGTGLEGRLSGIGTGLEGAHARNGRWKHTRSGTVLDEKCSGNGTELECSKKGAADLGGGCASNGVPLGERHTSGDMEPGGSSTGVSGVKVVIDLTSVQAENGGGEWKTDVHEGEGRGQKRLDSGWSEVPCSSIKILSIPAQHDMKLENVSIDCGKAETECGGAAGKDATCSDEHSNVKSKALDREVEDSSQWHEVVEGKSTGHKQPALPCKKVDRHVEEQSLPAPLLDIGRESVLDGSGDQEWPLLAGEPEKDSGGGGFAQGWPSPSDAAKKDLQRPSPSDAAEKDLAAGHEWSSPKKSHASGYDQEWPTPLDAAKKNGASVLDQEWPCLSVGHKKKRTAGSRLEGPCPSGKSYGSEFSQRGPYPSEERSRWSHSSEDRSSAGKKQPLPTFVDTHCHLEYVFERYEHQGTFASFKTEHNYPRNFDSCIASFCDPAAFSSLGIWSQLLSEGGSSGVWASFGIHPHNAKYYSGDLEEKLLKCIEHERCVAFGEIGLDYGPHSPSPPGMQKDILAHQLQLGVALGKPLVLHCRDAEDDLLRILSAHVPSEWKIHLHCFTGKPNDAFRFLNHYPNLYVGVTGSVTYETAYNVRNIAQRVSLERLLVETDAPYNTPRNLPRAGRCRYSHPAHAYYVAKEIANLKGVELWEVLRQIRENTRKLYSV